MRERKGRMIELIYEVDGKRVDTLSSDDNMILRSRYSRGRRYVTVTAVNKIKLATKPVTNLRAYLLTTLFNEPVIYETGIEMQVTQDMYRREAEAWQS